VNRKHAISAAVDAPDIIDSQEAAELLRYCAETVKRKARAGIIPGTKLAGARWRFSRAAIVKLVVNAGNAEDKTCRNGEKQGQGSGATRKAPITLIFPCAAPPASGYRRAPASDGKPKNTATALKPICGGKPGSGNPRR
jgi:excisionase family DNA binding protein